MSFGLTCLIMGRVGVGFIDWEEYVEEEDMETLSEGGSEEGAEVVLVTAEEGPGSGSIEGSFCLVTDDDEEDEVPDPGGATFTVLYPVL